MNYFYSYPKMNDSIKAELDKIAWDGLFIDNDGNSYTSAYDLRESKQYEELKHKIDYTNDPDLEEYEILSYYKMKRWLEYCEAVTKSVSQDMRKAKSDEMKEAIEEVKFPLIGFDHKGNDYLSFKVMDYLTKNGLRIVFEKQDGFSLEHETDYLEKAENSFPSNLKMFKPWEGFHKSEFKLSVYKGSVKQDNIETEDGKEIPFAIRDQHVKLEMFNAYKKGTQGWYSVIPNGWCDHKSYKVTNCKNPNKAIDAVLRMLLIALNDDMMYRLREIEKEEIAKEMNVIFNEGKSFDTRASGTIQSIDVGEGSNVRFSKRGNGFKATASLDVSSNFSNDGMTEEECKMFLKDVRELLKKHDKEIPND